MESCLVKSFRLATIFAGCWNQRTRLMTPMTRLITRRWTKATKRVLSDAGTSTLRRSTATTCPAKKPFPSECRFLWSIMNTGKRIACCGCRSFFVSELLHKNTDADIVPTHVFFYERACVMHWQLVEVWRSWQGAGPTDAPDVPGWAPPVGPHPTPPKKHHASRRGRTCLQSSAFWLHPPHPTPASKERFGGKLPNPIGGGESSN